MVRQTGQSATPRRSAALNQAPRILVLQKLGSVDRSHIEAHLLRLDAVDRQMRFCGMVSDRSISLYCEQIDWSLTINLGGFIDGQLRGMAELKMTRGIPASIAELAITVEQAFQDKGVGTALLQKMLVIARNRFVGKICMICLSENRKMQHVADKLDANLIFREGEVEGRIWPSLPTYLSFVEEASMDGQALWRAMLDMDATETRRSSGPAHAK
jgi:GNAT superfamily N-acetyltransferase